MKKPSLSTTEKGMVVAIVLLGIMVVLRWGYIRKRAADGMNFLKPMSDTAHVEVGSRQ